ncbi:MAG TPA: redoxin domain-containing protein [Candidatus Dormibacteraeota bacterium]|jgi:hypothetical protein
MLDREYRRARDVQVLMVSRGELEANKAKVREHGLTFPVVLQRRWEVSQAFGMFATPIAFLINKDGVIAAGAATGVEPILTLFAADGLPGHAPRAHRPAHALGRCNALA